MRYGAVFLVVLLGLGLIGAPGLAFANNSNSQSPEQLRAQLEQVKKQLEVLQRTVRLYALSESQAPSSSNTPKVGLQVGHWNMENLPYELRNLNPHRQARGGGKLEWEVNLEIAEAVKSILEEKGVEVDLLPAVVPVMYRADLFVSIHADQNPSMLWKSGYKVAPSSYDQSNSAAALAEFIDQEYRKATWLDRDAYIPATMKQYYAFNSSKFSYAIHPNTPGIIIETGYLPNPRDRAILLSNPHMAAKGIAQGILQFLQYKTSYAAL